MYVDKRMVTAWYARYGKPCLWSHRQSVSRGDYEIIRASQKKHGRRHDITLYIESDRRIAVMAKPFYPPDLYRAPSGGLVPGESLEDGAGREAIEETGLRIELRRYLLCAHVTFTSEAGTIEWFTHVFSAATNDHHIAPTDHHEAREARWADPREFEVFSRIMRHTPNGGLHYRAALHDQIAMLHPLFPVCAGNEKRPVTD